MGVSPGPGILGFILVDGNGAPWPVTQEADDGHGVSLNEAPRRIMLLDLTGRPVDLATLFAGGGGGGGSMDNGNTGTSLAAAGAPANGTELSFAGAVRTAHSMQVILAGGATAVIVYLQAFLGDWVTIGIWSTVDGRVSGELINVYDVPALKTRAVLNAIDAGTATAVLASK